MLKHIEKLDCGHPESPHSDFTRGYGADNEGKKHCYKCCAEIDRQSMRDTGKATLYLCVDGNAFRSQWRTSYGEHKLTNWPGSLSIPVRAIRKGRHNIAGVRYDFRFTFEGESWYGTQYGDNGQIAHCKRAKPRQSFQTIAA